MLIGIFLFWFLFAVIVGVLAGSWNRNGLFWTFLAFVVSPALAITARAQVGIAINENKCPVQIQDVKTHQIRRGAAYDLTYINIRAKPVKAVEFGLVSFGAFDDFLSAGRIADVGEIAPYGKTKESLEGTYYLYLGDEEWHYTGIAYVRRVRLEGGQIWKTNRDSVEAKIRREMKIPEIDLRADTTVAAPDTTRQI